MCRMCNLSIFSCASIASVCPIVPTTPVSARYCSNSNAPSSSGAYVTNLIKFPLASCHCLNCSIFAGTICSSGCAPARFLKHKVLLNEYIRNALLFLFSFAAVNALQLLWSLCHCCWEVSCNPFF